MGEYYYNIKEPSKAYESLNRAVTAYKNPPGFTKEIFYKETEEIGRTYALMGNIFYYFFDRVKERYGDLKDEELDDDLAKRGNYAIARDKYRLAIENGYESPEVRYNLGRVHYLEGNYQGALNHWLNLYDDFIKHPELMFALGNAYYHNGYLENSKGEYLKLISVFEYEVDKIKTVEPTSVKHIVLHQTLASTYNNLGAVYQLQRNEKRSDLSYWKAIDYARRIELENEYARVNLARSFKQTGEVGDPILDERIPYSIEIYREEMR
jgi:tetratricopeptide (TPR) repeat protein